jgi:hypothetical protein
MAVRVALDDDLVVAQRVAHDPGRTPTLFDVVLIALSRRVLSEVNVSLEAFKLWIATHKTSSFLLPT